MRLCNRLCSSQLCSQQAQYTDLGVMCYVWASMFNVYSRRVHVFYCRDFWIALMPCFTCLRLNTTHCLCCLLISWSSDRGYSNCVHVKWAAASLLNNAACCRCKPNRPASIADIRKLGVLSWQLDADNHENDPTLKAIRADRNYSYQVNRETM